MKFYVLTLFPEMIDALHNSIIGRAIDNGLIELEAVNIRDYTNDKHNKVDDYPYGGGAGMVISAQPVYDAYMSIADRIGRRLPCIYMTPCGRTLNSSVVTQYAALDEVVLLCGHYEGIDERVIEEIVTDRISIGDYVVTGGELPAMIMIDAISRFLPGVLHNDDSACYESFTDNLLEYPQYTRPQIWRERSVPSVLLSGDHKRVDEYRHHKSIEYTAKYRPDLLDKS